LRRGRESKKTGRSFATLQGKRRKGANCSEPQPNRERGVSKEDCRVLIDFAEIVKYEGESSAAYAGELRGGELGGSDEGNSNVGFESEKVTAVAPGDPDEPIRWKGVAYENHIPAEKGGKAMRGGRARNRRKKEKAQ